MKNKKYQIEQIGRKVIEMKRDIKRDALLVGVLVLWVLGMVFVVLPKEIVKYAIGGMGSKMKPKHV